MDINNLADFSKALSLIEPVDNEQLFFRGHSKESYKLLPTIYRKEQYLISEDRIFKDAIVNCPQDFKECRSAIEMLVKMQHYGIPTRILDITKSALVALLFACISNENENGEVIILSIPDREVRYYDSDRISILSNISKQNVDFEYFYDKTRIYQQESYDDYVDEVKIVNDGYFGVLLHSIKEEKPHFQNIISPMDVESVVAVQVKLDNARIIRQSGAFLVFGIINSKEIPANINQHWIAKPNNEKIIIPSGSKTPIINELNLLGINYSTLFPELDKQAIYIKDKYSKVNLKL